MRVLRWLYPGIGIKRWLLLSALGVLMLGLGLALIIDVGFLWSIEAAADRVFGPKGYIPSTKAGVALVGAGALLVVVALHSIVRSVYQATVPRGGESLGKILFTRRNLERGPKIVAVGGGTGLSVLLRGLKEYTDNLTAIVTVSDDGGSSGRLRQELGILPPGDIRNCLVAMADTEPLMERLFQYRFGEGSGLAGHSFGNLFIAAMTGITGDFEEAVRESSRVLAVRGRVLPTTLEDVTLFAELEDSKQIRGETAISATDGRIRRVYLEPRDAEPLPEAIAAIKGADAIVLGPGSLYTSVISNLAVSGVARAIREAGALKIYVVNVMTQPGETRDYTGRDHVKAVLDHGGEGCIDLVLLNNEAVPESVAAKYLAQGARPVVAETGAVSGLGVAVVEEPLAVWDGVVRHSSEKLARCLIRIILKQRGAVIRERLLEMYWSAEKSARAKG
jgi:uncharacterized cofD-like protein